MNKKKVLIVFGTRPEAIKMIPVVNAFRSDAELYTLVCNTAQHRQMTDQVLDYFDIAVDFDLDIMKSHQTLNNLFSRLLNSIDKILIKEQPDMVIVHGDTSTCLAASLAAFHLEVPVAHVEAGLRTYNFKQPFPEEMNRQMCDKISSLHFAPTQRSVDQLKKEIANHNSIKLVGNTIVDAVHHALPLINEKNSHIIQLKEWIDPSKKCIVITGHRRENFGTAMDIIINAIKTISKNEKVQIIYPVHLNPRVKDPVHNRLSGLSNVLLCEPLDYESFLWLLNTCDFIITDSGGIQEEATVLQKHVLVTRNTTERQEAVDSGHIRLVGSDYGLIVREAQALIHATRESLHLPQPYGSGESSIKILESVKSYLNE